MAAISLQDAEHYLWGQKCDGWWLKKDGLFTVIVEHMPPGTFEQKHFHQTTEQFFYCLEGTLAIQCKESDYMLKPGEGLSIRAGVIHKVMNLSDESVRFLVVSCPNSHKDRVDVGDIEN